MAQSDIKAVLVKSGHVLVVSRHVLTSKINGSETC